MRILIVTGWRGPLSEFQAGFVERAIDNALTPTTRIFVGDADGVDAVARSVVTKPQWGRVELSTYRANWDLLGRGAGPERNRRMVLDATSRITDAPRLMAFPHPTKSRGTWDCIKQAAAAGIVCKVVPINMDKEVPR